MFDPMSMMSMGLSAVGGLMGAAESRRTNEENKAINMMNLLLRERERQDALMAARQAREDAHLGMQDAKGGTVRFIPGKGWVQTLGLEDESIQDAQLREQFASLGDVAQRRRMQSDVTDRQVREGHMADVLLEAFQDVQRPSAANIRSQLQAFGARGINEGFDKTAGDAMRTAVRTGASNSGKVAAEIGRERGDALAKMFQEAAVKAPDIAAGRYNNDRTALLQMYGNLSDRSRMVPNASFTPQAIGGKSQDLIANFVNQLGEREQGLIGALGAKGGTADYQSPDHTLANAFIGMGSMAQGMGRQSSGSSELAERRRLRSQGVM